MSIKEKAVNTIQDVKLYWKTPPYGRHMTFKEIASLAIGSMGVKFMMFCVANMVLYVGNTLIGNTIGIPPKPMYAIYMITLLAGFPLTALRAKMIDNVRNKKGKYRPYILSMGLPTCILAIAFTWMPYDKMSLLVKCSVVLLFNIGFQFFYNFLIDANDSIINVLSPNTYERSDVCSIKSVVDSFAPTIANAILPFLARMITGENTLFDMRIYRLVYPPVIVGGFLLSLLIYKNTEEKIVQAKTHSVQMSFLDSFRAVAKNKYFWIISLAGWLGFLESSFGNILSWLYNYQDACSPAEYSLIGIINGNAALWPMLFAPFLIRALGKRNILIYSNIMSIFFILAMFPIVRYGDPKNIIWLLLICLFVNGMVTTLGHILTPSLNGDIRDYQQYITGERIDGMFVAVGLIGSVITMATNFVLPAIYEAAGLNETVAISLGYDGSNVYNVLYNIEYFKSICGILVIASAVGAVMNVIPFFFYDLTEIKQKAMVTVLKIRALFEDYGNNALKDEALIEAIDLIDEANMYVDKEPVKLSKSDIKSAKRTRDKIAVKKAKEEYRLAKETNEKIQIAQFVVKEINKFSTPEVQSQVERAEKIVNAGLDGLLTLNTISIETAKAMPKNTPEEKKSRSSAIAVARAERDSKKIVAKYYPNGITEFDMSTFDLLFNEEDSIDSNLKTLYAELNEAKSNKNSERISAVEFEMSSLKKDKARVKREISKATKESSIYNRAAKPYLDAQKLLIQQVNYGRYEEIRSQYQESKERAEKERLAKSEREAKQQQEKEAYATKMKEEKRNSKRKK